MGRVRGLLREEKSMAVTLLLLLELIAGSSFLNTSQLAANSLNQEADANYTIYIYHDERYPHAWLSPYVSEVIIKYASNLLSRFSIEHVVVDADQLRSVALTQDPNKSILIFSQDVVPDTVWNGSSSSIIVRWLRDGATLIWSGGWEFYYIGHDNGTATHLQGIEEVPFGKTVTVKVEAEASASSSGAQFLPSMEKFSTLRPFSEELLNGFYYEVYGDSYTEMGRVIDPALVKVGNGFFVKIGATGYHLDPLDRILYLTELILNRFYGLTVDLKDGLTYFSPHDSGIVYILPHGASTPHWSETYGDRIYFYTHSNITQYADYILVDLAKIAEVYTFIILMIPLEDTDLFYQNIRQMDKWAKENRIKILYAILPKWKYEPEEYYLRPGSVNYNLIISNMLFLNNLSSTMAVSTWYGWKYRAVDTSEIEDFYVSLPDELRERYQLWIDEPFLEDVIEAGLPDLSERLNLTVVTEIYTPLKLALYATSFKDQIVVTGKWSGESGGKWTVDMRRKIDFVLTKTNRSLQKRTLGVWIFWDENDGSKERYSAYLNGALINPLSSMLPPIADFDYTPDNPTVNQSITFKDLSTDLEGGEIVSWSWDLGEGIIFTQRNPVHSFDAIGTRNVSLTVTNDLGASSSVTRSITVTGNSPPQVSFSLTPSIPIDNQDVQFSDESVDLDGSIVEWLWEFGDGAASSDQNPVHVFQKGGEYDVRLTVRDSGGKSASAYRTVNIVQTWPLTLQVKDVLGFTVPDAEIVLYRDGERLASGSTDSEGNLTLPRMRGGYYEARIEVLFMTTFKDIYMTQPTTEKILVVFSLKTTLVAGILLTAAILIPVYYLSKKDKAKRGVKELKRGGNNTSKKPDSSATLCSDIDGKSSI